MSDIVSDTITTHENGGTERRIVWSDGFAATIVSLPVEPLACPARFRPGNHSAAQAYAAGLEEEYVDEMVNVYGEGW